MEEKLKVVATPDLYKKMFGTEHTAEFISPRLNYLQLAAADGPMMLMITLAERAISAVENLGFGLQKRKDLYRFKTKQCCRLMMEEVARWRKKLGRNLKDDDFDYEEQFAYILDYVDDALKEDIRLVKYSVLNELNRRKVANADVMTECTLTLLLVDCYKAICNIVTEKTHGSVYALCIDPHSGMKREDAIELRPDLLKAVRMRLREVFETLDSSEDFTLTECKAVNDGFKILINKMVSPEILVPASVQQGFEINEGASRKVRTDVGPEEASRLAACVNDNTDYDDEKRLKRTLKKRSVEDGFSEKGWKVG